MDMRTDITPVTLDTVDVTGGFWAEKQRLIRDVSMWNVYKRFKETGRFDAFRFIWREGMENKPHIFWDSDVAKWIEAAAYFCKKQRDPSFEKIIDDIADAIEKNRMEDGYFNSYYGLIEPQNRFTERWNHELYCAGHLLEGAIAYRDATGKDKLFNLMRDYIDLIYKVFYVEKSAKFSSPGHEEIELALVKLYRATGDKKYLDLSLYFVNDRGISGNPYFQDHLPVRAQKTAEGHSVRACYFYCAVADLAKETGDQSLADAAETLFSNIVNRRMYVTGAIGQTCVGESFMGDYDLPNQTAYAETCANLSLALFARRMSFLCPDAKYADIAELVLYNSFLSGISLDGKSFFYSNMQESDLHVRHRQYNDGYRLFCPADTRVEVFGCSCCPPNVVRTIASVQDFAYMSDADTVYVNQYLTSTAKVGEKTLSVETGYPYGRNVKITYSGVPGFVAVRIPGWCRKYAVSVNGEESSPKVEKGYAYIPVSGGETISLMLDMPVRFVEANPRVWEDAGRVAVMRGPIVYCMEGIDHERDKDCSYIRDIRLSEKAEYRQELDKTLGVPVLKTVGRHRDWDADTLYSESGKMIDCPVTLIPYFAFANRGETELVIWTLKN